MASDSTPLDTGSLQKSQFQQTVCLADWWLVKAESDIQRRRLAVAGFTFREKQAMRFFSSAPILKRYDPFTVETTDGICVILKGFLDKDRTVENGFPSDVFKYFVFGFPPHWKEYDEKLMGKESEFSGVDLLKKLSPQSGMEGGQSHVDSREKDFGSEGKMNAKGMRKSKKTKPSSVPLPQNSGSVSSEDNLNMTWTASEGLKKESYCGGPSAEDYTTPESLVNCLKNKMKSLSDYSSVGSINVSAVLDKDIRILSACHLDNGRTKGATDDLRKVESDKNNATNADFDGDMSSSEGINLSRNEARVRTRLMSLKLKEKNNQTSARISGGQKIRINSISSRGREKGESAYVDSEPGSGNNQNLEVSAHGFEQVPETKNQVKRMRNIKTRSSTQKAKNKETKSLHTPPTADDQMDKIIAGKYSLSKKPKALVVETRRKLEYVSKETPVSQREKVPGPSPQSLSFNRSRSGRLLMPTLEFWRNQRAIYTADRTITGIEEGMDPEQSSNGSGSTSLRKRKQSK